MAVVMVECLVKQTVTKSVVCLVIQSAAHWAEN